MAKRKYKGSSVKRGNLVSMEGVSELLKAIEKAGGSVDRAVMRAADKSLEIVGEDMQRFMAGHIDTGLTYESYDQVPASMQDTVTVGKMKYKVKSGVMAKVGYDTQKGGLPAIFLDVGTTAGENGTPRREGHYFRYYAVENNLARIKQAQQDALNEILKGLK